MTVDPFAHCGRGICAAGDGHEGTCSEASGWDEPLTTLPADPQETIRRVLRLMAAPLLWEGDNA